MSGVYTDRQGEWIGDVAMAHPESDVTVLNIFSGGISPHYYDGDWTTNSGKHIARANINNNGDYVCTSGAMSGVHCNNQVYNDNTWYKPDSLDYVIKPVIKAKRTNLTEPASVSGDSGGPVVTTADGTCGHGMEARDTISGGGGDYVVCDPNGVAEPNNPNIKCHTDVFYSPIMPTLTVFGLAIAI
ncbi:hypothetical protein [Streptomyces sp. NPDC097981]|uniref:hypothetical protein n=1 Tax=Streptomyces sp. NPDC097981 TaxID=3155428 RepID=UPI00333385B1